MAFSYPSPKWRWLRKWGALMLGVGAIVPTGDGRARSPEFALPEPISANQLHSGRFDDVLMRIEGDKIYVSQRGGVFEELSMGDTPYAAHLRSLFRDAAIVDGIVSVPVGSTVVANGGGYIDGVRPKQPETSTPADKQSDKKGEQPATNTKSTKSKSGNGK